MKARTDRFAILLTAAGLAACSGSSAAGGEAGGNSSGSGGSSAGGVHSAGNAGSSSGAGGSAGASGAAAGSGGAAASPGGAAGGSGDPWRDCPTAEQYDGDDSWPHALEVTPEAVYCAAFDESRTLTQELAAKARLRIAPGSYRLPASSRAGLGLPACIQFGPREAPEALTAQDATYSSFVLSGNTSHRYAFAARATDAERRLSIELSVTRPTLEVPAFVLDGTENDPFDDSLPGASFFLCRGPGEACAFDRLFDSCTHASSTLNRHDVVLDTGPLSLELRIGESVASTEPGAFVRASGSFRGRSVDQRDYFKLVYHPAHHHFERAFAVLFDQPIDGACGVEIGGIEPFGDSTPDFAHAIDCDLTRLEPLEVMSQTLTREP